MIKVLHVVTHMGRGGLEVWLMELLRRIDTNKFKVDVLVQSSTEGLFDKEIKELGCGLIRCPGRGNPIAFSKNFAKILDEHGPYDIVHSHVHHFSAFPLLVAKLKGVKTCIAHCHNIVYSNNPDLSWKTKAYLAMTKFIINRVVSYGFGCSKGAAEDLYTQSWQTHPNRDVLHCGIKIFDETPSEKLEELKTSLNIEKDKKVIGHVGRFMHQKNHDLIFDILEQVVEQRNDFVMLLVGEGQLKQKFLDKVAANKKLEQCVRFLGDRGDVPELLQIMDIFLFPSRHEGLGLALVEAQAAGLHCLITDEIPHEAHAVPELIHTLTLNDSVDCWANKLNDLLDNYQKQPQLGNQTVKASSHNIETCVNRLSTMYDEFATQGK